jgi:hypothetical protein
MATGTVKWFNDAESTACARLTLEQLPESLAAALKATAQ